MNAITLNDIALLLREQNDLLRQMMVATRPVPTEIDGVTLFHVRQEVAKDLQEARARKEALRTKKELKNAA